MEKEGKKLKKALVETKMIPWQYFSHFSGVISKHIPICVDAMREVGLKLYDNLYVPCHMHYLSAEEAANVEVPEWVTIAFMEIWSHVFCNKAENNIDLKKIRILTNFPCFFPHFITIKIYSRISIKF